MRSLYRIAFAGLLFLFPLNGISQVTESSVLKGVEKEQLPATQLGACAKAQGIQTAKPFESETVYVEPLHRGFWSPTPIQDKLSSLKSDFAALYRASLSPKGEAGPIGRRLSENLAQFAQTYIESILVAPKGKRLTCLLRFSTDENGAVLWRAVFVVMGDADFFRTYPSSTFRALPQGGLSASILARDIDRANLSSVIAVEQRGGLGLACGPLLPEQIPWPRVGK